MIIDDDCFIFVLLGIMNYGFKHVVSHFCTTMLLDQLMLGINLLNTSKITKHGKHQQQAYAGV